MKTVVVLVLAVPILSAINPVAHSIPGVTRIVFFGDSITEQGDVPGGYVSIIRDSLARSQAGQTLEVLGKGRSGDKVPDLIGRLDSDVLSHHPAVVVIYIGINDVWHFTKLLRRGTPKDEYARGLRLLVNKLLATDARVVLCTPSVIGERYDGTNQLDPMLDEYADISREIAHDLHVPLCDLRRSFVDHLREHNPRNADYGILTSDGVHLNENGNRLVAREILSVLSTSGIVNAEE